MDFIVFQFYCISKRDGVDMKKEIVQDLNNFAVIVLAN